MRSHAGRGFTLLELAVVLAIIGLVIAISINAGHGVLESVTRGQNATKLNTLEDALMAFRTVNNRLPCPANPALATTNVNYGKEAGTPGDCTGTGILLDGAHSVVEGAVPFKTLGLGEKFMYDAWDHKFAYAVNSNVTAPLAMQSQTLSEQCGISVNDAVTVGGRTAGALYALISYGPNGHGSYLQNGTRYSASSTNADEQINCHCNSSGVSTAYASQYVAKDAVESATVSSNDVFDDTVRFKERWQMVTPDDLYSTGAAACSLGIRIDGAVASQGLTVMGTADLNGDGKPDLLLQGTEGGAMRIYVVFARTSSYPQPFKTSDLDGSNGFSIDEGGGAYGAYTAASMVKGDFNGDGIDDVALLYSRPNGLHPQVWILYGQSNWPATFTLNTLTDITSPKATHVVISDVPVYSIAAASLHNATNVTKIDDLIIGIPQDNGNAGAVYVAFGKAMPAAVVNAGVNPDGVTFTGGEAGSYTGSSIAVGDFDGDNIQDIAIGAEFTGFGYIVWGQSSLTNMTLDGAMVAGKGVEINKNGGAIGGFFGRARAGNVNGGSVDNVIFGAPNATCSTGGNCGINYVLFNGASLKSASTFNITTLNGSNGVAVEGNWGIGDIGIGYNALLANSTGSGNSLFLPMSSGGSNYRYAVFYARSTWLTSSVNTSSLDGTTGFRFTGLTGTGGGSAFADIKGNGFADYIMGNIGASPGGRGGAGSVYVVKGQAPATLPAIPAALDVSSLLTYGYEFDGAAAGDALGGNITTLDLNHDGIQDMAITAAGASPYGIAQAGSVYVIWGRQRGWGGTAVNLGSVGP